MFRFSFFHPERGVLLSCPLYSAFKSTCPVLFKIYMSIFCLCRKVGVMYTWGWFFLGHFTAVCVSMRVPYTDGVIVLLTLEVTVPVRRGVPASALKRKTKGIILSSSAKVGIHTASRNTLFKTVQDVQVYWTFTHFLKSRQNTSFSTKIGLFWQVLKSWLWF